jgi:hypothetical protein
MTPKKKRRKPVDQLSSIINNIDLNSTEKNTDELPPPPSHPPKLVREVSQAPRRQQAPQAPSQHSDAKSKKGVRTTINTPASQPSKSSRDPSDPALTSLRLALGASGSEEESPNNKIILKFQFALSDEKIGS